MKKAMVPVCALACAALAQPARAQFIRWSEPKTVPLAIPHAPESGLMVKRVAFGQAKGDCASELVDRMLLPDFQGSHVDVIERQHLDEILAEHNFNQTAYADPASAARLGKILGPSALIIVSVYSCQPSQQPLYNDVTSYNGTVQRTFISKTRFTLEGSVQVVNLTTGEVLGSHNFQSKPERQNAAQNGQPEFPPVDEVKDEAMQEAKTQIHNMFFPGTEVAQLTFYDDKDCGLKQAYELFHRGDRADGEKQAASNLEGCQSGHKKDKTLARANYDAALAYCMAQDYDKAKELFTQAMQSKGAEAAAQASAACSRAQDGAARVRVYQDQIAHIPDPSPISTVAEATPSAQPAVSAPPPAAQPQPASVAAPAPAKPSAEERLKKLDQLLKQGLITRKDYDAKKAQILSEL